MKMIMVVDDEERAAIEVSLILEKEGYTVAKFTDAASAIKTLEAVQDIDLILTDIRMPGMDGTEILKAAQRSKKPVPVIVCTGYGDVETAVNIMRSGASDFLCKPVSSKELLVRVKKVLENSDLAGEVVALRKRLETVESSDALILTGRSKKMVEVYDLTNSVAQTDATVLLRGETGTGKELVARAIHDSGSRKNEPFVAISCTAVQHTLLESVLFGHEKGAFTGAHAPHVGKMEAAGSGTIFLDEIGDTSLDIQAKLLRVLQEREFERVGGSRMMKLNARVVAATNKDLEQAVREGEFREDLYYRLNVVEIRLPPLREREEDILFLADHFLNLFKRRYQKDIEGFSPSAVNQILDHGWPGNVRELKNAIERTVLTNPRRWIDRIPRLVSSMRAHEEICPCAKMVNRVSYIEAKEDCAEELEKAYLTHYLKQEHGHINRVADLMGVSTRTVARQMEKFGLDKSSFKDRKSAV
ncbi:MAG: sigma-54-dependent Fis family transcriptional regulator [Deltaproteobacteria bacterium]|nr:sigma-54-dependent Fis family transcriptional regulator [Deltaproteobacteria bacterium]